MAWQLARTGPPHADAVAWGSILVLAVLTSIVGYVAWYWALAKGGISRIAGVQFTQPLFGLVLAAIVLGERPGPVTLVAGVAILSGAWLVGRASTPDTLTA
jgi:drug/metabolite transporter (DMT)-like permease